MSRLRRMKRKKEYKKSKLKWSRNMPPGSSFEPKPQNSGLLQNTLD
jgi:hypothetical protein